MRLIFRGTGLGALLLFWSQVKRMNRKSYMERWLLSCMWQVSFLVPYTTNTLYWGFLPASPHPLPSLFPQRQFSQGLKGLILISKLKSRGAQNIVSCS